MGKFDVTHAREAGSTIASPSPVASPAANLTNHWRIGPIGTLTTKTLVISGESGFTATPTGRGAKLYAYDKATGKEVANIFMPAPQTGSPMTYMLGGKQYLIVAISGAGFPAELIAYKVAE